VSVAEPARWRQVKEVLGEALERDAVDRAAFLGHLQATDPELAREVQSLLGWYAASGNVLTGEVDSKAKSLAAGDRLGPYEIVDLLGTGGMGCVYRARDSRLGRLVALKVHVSGSDASGALRFEREARAVAAVAHPHIVAIFDFGHQDQLSFAATELLEGETLRQRLRQGPLPLAEVLRIAVHVLSGLAAAHQQGIVHRDLKPENIFLCTDGITKILDFGLAKLALPLAADPSRDSNLTRAGVLMGTVGYMAPEQVRGQDLDARADIFSFGVTLYEMLSGQRPFARGTPAETLAAVLRDAPRPLDTKVVPPGLVALVGRCLAKEPEARYSSAAEVQRQLGAIRPVTVGRTRRQVAAAALLALTLVGFGSTHAGRSRTGLRTPDNVVQVGRNPYHVAFGGGHVWVPNHESNTVTRLDATDGRVTATFRAGIWPVAVAWDGTSVWVANHKWLDDYSELLRLDPHDGHVLASVRLGGQPNHLAVDDEHLWVTETWPSYALRKIRLRDAVELGAYTAAGTPRQPVTDGASVWVTNTSVGAVSRIRASDGKVLVSREVGGAPAFLQLVGPDLWVHNQAGTMLQIRADDLTISRRLPLDSIGFAVTPRWIFAAEPGRIVQRDRVDAREIASWKAGPNSHLAFDGQNLWATDYEDDTVTMISARSLSEADPDQK
jgi:tRNA A-37 threonylcarbamoyl transferase component Bud32